MILSDFDALKKQYDNNSLKLGHLQKCNLCGFETEYEFLKYMEDLQDRTRKTSIFNYFNDNVIPNYFCPKCNSTKEDREILLILSMLNKQDVLVTGHELLNDFINYENMNVDFLSADELLNLDDINLDKTYDLIITVDLLSRIENYKDVLNLFNNVLKKDALLIIKTNYEESLLENVEEEYVNTPTLRSTYYGNKNDIRVFGSPFKEFIESMGFSFEVKQLSYVVDGNLPSGFDENSEYILCYNNGGM